MQIAICEGSDIDRGLFSDILVSYFNSKSLTVSVKQYQNGIELLGDIEDGKWYDSIFIDIYMGNVHGIEIARHLRKMGYDGKLVFLTMSTDYVVESYEVEASGYILKPYDYKAVENILNRITNYTSVSNISYYVKQRSKYVSIPYHEIIYIESNNSKCILHRTEGRDYNIYKRLDEIEEELSDKRFLRCHQSYLVNMDYILQVDKQFILTTGDCVLIRQRDVKAIRDKYYDFVTTKKKIKRFIM